MQHLRRWTLMRKTGQPLMWMPWSLNERSLRSLRLARLRLSNRVLLATLRPVPRRVPWLGKAGSAPDLVADRLKVSSLQARCAATVYPC